MVPTRCPRRSCQVPSAGACGVDFQGDQQQSARLVNVCRNLVEISIRDGADEGLHLFFAWGVATSTSNADAIGRLAEAKAHEGNIGWGTGDMGRGVLVWANARQKSMRQPNQAQIYVLEYEFTYMHTRTPSMWHFYGKYSWGEMYCVRCNTFPKLIYSARHGSFHTYPLKAALQAASILKCCRPVGLLCPG